MEADDWVARVRDALRRVADPEVGESIVDLGLVERVARIGERIEVVLIPTSATCPMSDVLVDEAAAEARRVLPAHADVDVRVDFDVPWSPDRMSPALRERFGWNGGDA